jgi:putative membrane protein
MDRAFRPATLPRAVIDDRTGDGEMHVGRSYRLIDFMLWSRRSALYMVVVSLLAVAAYTLPPDDGLSIPWSIVVVLGTTVSLVTGFKNSQVLQRSSDALAAFAQIAASSRMLASLSCDFLDRDTATRVIHRHLAWLTALRFSLRRAQPWESMSRPANREFRRRRYHIQEDSTALPDELERLLGKDSIPIMSRPQPALTLLHHQGTEINALLKGDAIPTQVYSELQKLLRDLHDQQARCDRIKNTPYPRQYAIVSAMFVGIFCTLLPFGAVPIFAEISSDGGATDAVMTWLSVPFSVLVGWVYFSLDQVGEATSNPFEGNANDVPISQICRDLEIELRGRLGEADLPPALEPVHGIAT